MIKEITQKSDWNNVLKQMNDYDFYHTYDYHAISIQPKEQAILVTYTKDSNTIALPLVLRPIPNTDFYDFTSVYGYAGPLSNITDTDFDYSDFKTQLDTYLKSKSIISVFSRLHPYYDQECILETIGHIEPLGDVVNIDITLPVEISRRAYGKSNKNQINKLRRECTVVKAKHEQDILEFIDIYNENMERLNAEKHYFFSKDYFINFLKITDFDTDILLVKENSSNTYIAGAMFVKTNNSIVQYHLSGTRTAYLRMKPSKLFLDEMRLLATYDKYKYFNLGGGLGSTADSLFEFKASFSKDFRTFRIWKYIVNQNVYNELSKEVTMETNYFPKYRIE